MDQDAAIQKDGQIVPAMNIEELDEFISCNKQAQKNNILGLQLVYIFCLILCTRINLFLRTRNCYGNFVCIYFFLE